MNSIKVKKIFETSTTNLKKHLDKIIKENQQTGKIILGAWLNQYMVLGYLSYYRTEDPTEDAIDFLFNLNLKLNIVGVTYFL